MTAVLSINVSKTHRML